MLQRKDWIVDFDKDWCIGCKACTAACPYDATFINPEDHTRSVEFGRYAAARPNRLQLAAALGEGGALADRGDAIGSQLCD